MFAIDFGGYIFVIISFVFILFQSIALFNDKNGLSLGVLAGYAAAMFFLVDDWPTFNYRWLIVYPFLALLWLPVYWYLDLLRRASRIKSLVLEYGSLKNLHDSLRYDDPVIRDLKADGGVVKADLKHPGVDDLSANALLFPLSIPLFFGENAVKMTINYLKRWMEDIKRKFNESINNFRVD